VTPDRALLGALSETSSPYQDAKISPKLRKVRFKLSQATRANPPDSPFSYPGTRHISVLLTSLPLSLQRAPSLPHASIPGLLTGTRQHAVASIALLVGNMASDGSGVI